MKNIFKLESIYLSHKFKQGVFLVQLQRKNINN